MMNALPISEAVLNKVFCPVCKADFSKREHLVYHYSSKHEKVELKYAIIDEKLSNLEEFVRGLGEKSGIEFCRVPSKSRDPQVLERFRHWLCPIDNSKSNREINKAERKLRASTCTAYVSATKQRDGTFGVRYCNDHSHPRFGEEAEGETDEVAASSLFTSIKDEAGSSEGYPPEKEILSPYEPLESLVLTKEEPSPAPARLSSRILMRRKAPVVVKEEPSDIRTEKTPSPRGQKRALPSDEADGIPDKYQMLHNLRHEKHEILAVSRRDEESVYERMQKDLERVVSAYHHFSSSKNATSKAVGFFADALHDIAQRFDMGEL